MTEGRRPDVARGLARKAWLPALHVFLIACAVGSAYASGYCEDLHGRYFRAAWDAQQADFAAARGEPGGERIPYERQLELRRACARWEHWRDVAAWPAWLTFGASVLAFLIQPGKLAAASCLLCGLLALAFNWARVYY